MKTASVSLAWVVAVAATVALVPEARAQSSKSNHHHRHAHRGHLGYYGHGYYHGGGLYHHASTYEEGVLRGTADVIRARGDYRIANGVAENLEEEAERRRLENEVRRTETFFAKRAINKAARFTETKEAAAARRQRIANNARPDRLGPTQYRADLGLLNWPSMLRRPEFDSLRGAVDDRVRGGETALRNHSSELHQLAGSMREAMRPLIQEVPPHDYAAARRFLESLQYEAQTAGRGTTMVASSR